MSSNNNNNANTNNIMSNNFPSLFIPRVYPNITEDRIRKIFQELALGELDRIDIINKTSDKGEKFNRVIVHFKMWYTEGNAEVAREKLLKGKDIKIMYDDPWIWKVSAYKQPSQKSLAEKKQTKSKVALIIEDSDEEKPAPAYNKPQYEERRPAANNYERPHYDDRRPAAANNYYERPHYEERRPANNYYEDDQRRKDKDIKPKPNESFKKTKKSDFNNIAPALPEDNRPYKERRADSKYCKQDINQGFRDRKQPKTTEPVAVKQEPVALKQESLDFTAFEPALIKITPENAAQYIGEFITFKHDGNSIVKRIESVSDTGKSIRVDCPEVENSLQIVTRNVYLLNGAIIPAAAEKPLMKPRVIKSKEQKEKERKANQLLASYAISSQIIYPGV